MIQKLDPNSGLHAKNQREIYSTKVSGLLEGENAGTGGGKWYKERGKCIVQNWVSRPNINDFRHPTCHKVFEKMLEKGGKNEGENYFSPTLVFNSKTRSQFRPACKKSERNL